MTRRLVSIVIPVLNEADNIPRVYDELVAALGPLEPRYELEFVFTDNHSTDATFEKLCRLAGDDHRVRVYRFSRNYGFQASILTGYLQAQGDAIVQIDADLQDPPSLILEFVRQWELGYQVVYGVRRSRKEGWLITNTRKTFYILIDWLSEYPLPRNAGDFRLITRPVVDQIRTMDDAFPYLRGIIPGLGFDQIGVPYDRDPRTAGESKFSVAKLIALAIDGIVASSVVPLRLATYLGLLISLFAVFGVLFYVGGAIFLQQEWPSGFATLAVLQTAALGLNALFLGIIGEYLGRMYQQGRRRPLTVIEFAVENGRVQRRSTTGAANAPEYTRD